MDRQERLCREVVERLELVITSGGVLVDNNRSAWLRNRLRPGWNALLEATRAGQVWHVIVYHPDRLSITWWSNRPNTGRCLPR